VTTYAHTFWQVRPKARSDGVAYTSVTVREGPAEDGPLLDLDTITTSFPADITVEGQYADGWYELTFNAADGSVERWPAMREDDFRRGRPDFFYTTRDEVRLALSPDGDVTDEGSAASLADNDLDDAVADAQAEVDGKIGGGRFNAATVPELVQNLTRDIAAYLATLTHRRGDPIDPNDPVQKRYDRAQSLLAGIQSGKIELSGEPEADSVDATIANVYEGDLFTLASMGIGASGGRRITPFNWDLDGPITPEW
jgi:phage gp36-like protein